MRADYLPFHIPDIGEEEIRAVAETMRSGWLTTGPRVKEFEAAFASFIGARHAIALNSCTAALHLAPALGARLDRELRVVILAELGLQVAVQVIERELGLLDRYVAIQRVRFQDRLTVNCNI